MLALKTMKDIGGRMLNRQRMLSATSACGTKCSVHLYFCMDEQKHSHSDCGMNLDNKQDFHIILLWDSLFSLNLYQQ